MPAREGTPVTAGTPARAGTPVTTVGTPLTTGKSITADASKNALLVEKPKSDSCVSPIFRYLFF